MLYIPPTNLILLAAKQEPYKKKQKKLSLNEKKMREKNMEKVQKNGPAGRKR